MIIDEKLVDNSFRLGKVLRNELSAITHPKLQAVRGKGLMNAIVIDDSAGASAMDVCLALRDRGLLAKPTHGNIIRCATPPKVVCHGGGRQGSQSACVRCEPSPRSLRFLRDSGVVV